jgi:hypothetical protein
MADRRHIGSSGLEQGGANLGNDYSRPITTDRNEQNTTTNVGEGTGTGHDFLADKESKLNLDLDENDETTDADEGDQGGSLPDPEELKTRDI